MPDPVYITTKISQRCYFLVSGIQYFPNSISSPFFLHGTKVKQSQQQVTGKNGIQFQILERMESVSKLPENEEKKWQDNLTSLNSHVIFETHGLKDSKISAQCYRKHLTGRLSDH